MFIKKNTIYSIYFLSIIFITPIYTDDSFLLGLENIPDSFIQKIKNARIGLITNQTGKNQLGQRNIDILLKKGLNIKTIFVPEHGLSGTILAGKDVDNSIDKITSIPKMDA